MMKQLRFSLALGIFLMSAVAGASVYYEGQGSPSSASSVQPVTFFPALLPDFAGLVKKVQPAVVNVSTKKENKVKRRPGPSQQPFGGQRDPFFDEFFERFFGQQIPDRPQRSLGSGFIINEQGYILTNNHVIEGADEIQVQLPDKRKFQAKVIGSDPKTDISVIRIEGKDLPFATLGDSDKLQVGDWVMAVGNPFGLDSTVTAGIVSAKGRVIGAGPYDDFIQTDASINPGNSGGPLFNLKGEVVGINTAIFANGQGIGFAIPVNLAKTLVPQLINTGKVTRAWLGVGIQDMTPELAQSFKITDGKGALIANVFPGSPAEKGGLKSGDVIRSFDGKEINDSRDLPAFVATEPIGKEVVVKLLREGQPLELKIKLGEMEAGETAAKGGEAETTDALGLAVKDLAPQEAMELGLAPGSQGVRVVQVDPNGISASAGIEPGDLILQVNLAKTNSAREFAQVVGKVKKGELIQLLVRREDGQLYVAFPKP